MESDIVQAARDLEATVIRLRDKITCLMDENAELARENRMLEKKLEIVLKWANDR